MIKYKLLATLVVRVIGGSSHSPHPTVYFKFVDRCKCFPIAVVISIQTFFVCVYCNVLGLGILLIFIYYNTAVWGCFA